MAEPTQDQKMLAANEALAAMDPPVTSSIIGDRLAEAVVAIVWSQVPMMPAAEAPGSDEERMAPLFFQFLSPSTPELKAKVQAYNQKGAELAEEILHAPS